MRHQPVRCAFGFDLLRRLAKGKRLGLREDVGHQQVMMVAERVQRLEESEEVARDQPRALMNQLVEAVLSIGAGLAPVDRAGLVGDMLPR